MAHFQKKEVSFFFCKNRKGGFPHEQALTVENPRSHQITLDYFYGQSGELFSYHGTDESYRVYGSKTKKSISEVSTGLIYCWYIKLSSEANSKGEKTIFGINVVCFAVN